jgi:hypothetical protein
LLRESAADGPEAFALLDDPVADPASHAAIDGAGWVGKSLDGSDQLTTEGQVLQSSAVSDRPAPSLG